MIADLDYSSLKVWLGNAKTTHVEPQSFYHIYHWYKDAFILTLSYYTDVWPY